MTRGSAQAGRTAAERTVVVRGVVRGENRPHLRWRMARAERGRFAGCADGSAAGEKADSNGPFRLLGWRHGDPSYSKAAGPRTFNALAAGARWSRYGCSGPR